MAAPKRTPSRGRYSVKRTSKPRSPKLSKPRRKSITNPLRNPLLRRLADMRRDDRGERAEAILKAARAVEPACTSAVDAPQRERELIRPVAGALRQIRQNLDLICSCAIVVHNALSEQNADLDEDAAFVLQRCVSDPLWDQILRLDALLADHPADDGEEDL